MSIVNGFNNSIDYSNILLKDNTTIYTPEGDYNPATKQYVDSNITTVNDSITTIQGNIPEVIYAATNPTMSRDSNNYYYLSIPFTPEANAVYSIKMSATVAGQGDLNVNKSMTYINYDSVVTSKPLFTSSVIGALLCDITLSVVKKGNYQTLITCDFVAGDDTSQGSGSGTKTIVFSTTTMWSTLTFRWSYTSSSSIKNIIITKIT